MRRYAVASLAVLAAPLALGQSTVGARLTDGDAVLDVGNATPTSAIPSTPTLTAVPSGNFRVAGGTGGADNSFSNWWWYRIAGDTRERAFHAGTLGTGVTRTLTGTNQVDYLFPNMTNNGTSVFAGLSSNMTWVLSDTGTDSANVYSRLAVTNTSASPVEIDLFFHHDIFLGGQDAGDIIDPFVYDSSSRMINTRDVTTTTTPTWFHQLRGFDAAGAGAGGFSAFNATMTNALVDNWIPDVNPGGLAAADQAQGMQWRFTIAPGATLTAHAAMCAVRAIPIANNGAGSVACVATPEPASLVLLALGGLLSLRRR